jgi:hypothetical protein
MKPIRSLVSAVLLVGFIAVAGTAIAQVGVLSDQESTPDGDHSSLKMKVQAGRMTSLPPETTKASGEDLTKSVGSALVTRDELRVDGMTEEEIIRLLIAQLYLSP